MRVLCFICKDYSSTHNNLLETANIEHLHLKEMKEMACEVVHFLTQIAPTFIQNLIILKCSQYSLRKDQTPAVPKANTSKCGFKSFVNDGPQFWNSLPNDLRKSVNYSEFRKLIRNWDWPSCNCSICRPTANMPIVYGIHACIYFMLLILTVYHPF